MDAVELDGLPPVDPAALEAARARRLVREVIATRQLAERLADLEALQRGNVARLRAEQVSWAIIGDALGVSRQAAQQRYGRGGGL